MHRAGRSNHRWIIGQGARIDGQMFSSNQFVLPGLVNFSSRSHGAEPARRHPQWIEDTCLHQLLPWLVCNFLRHVSAYDPTRPQKSWRSAWRTLTRKAGLAGFRFHDLRHCAITHLAESGVADSIIMAIAGHVSRRMLERYSHIRMEAKRKALQALSGKAGDRGYATNNVTNLIPANNLPV